MAAPSRIRFGADDLRHVREMTEHWAARAGLPPERTDDFVIAVNEIATNAIRYGSPAARLLLQVTENMAEAEVRDDGRWQAAAPAGSDRGGMGLPLARRVCDAVEIRPDDSGTTVTLRMRLRATQ